MLPFQSLKLTVTEFFSQADEPYKSLQSSKTKKKET